MNWIQNIYDCSLRYNKCDIVIVTVTWISVRSPIHFAIASAPNPTRWISIVSAAFGLPLGGKCIYTGAVFNFIWKISILSTSSHFLVFSTYQPKNIGSFIKINRSKEQLVGVQWRISEGISHYCKFVIGMSKITIKLLNIHRCFSAVTYSSINANQLTCKSDIAFEAPWQ